MTEPGQIQLSCYLEYPPARVWAALTEPALHAQWWAAGDIRPMVGHHFTLDMGQWGRQACTILAVEPEQQLAYTFAAGVLDTTISWHLTAEGHGTRLALEHRGFDLRSPLGRAAFQGLNGGWPGVLARIAPVLAQAA